MVKSYGVGWWWGGGPCDFGVSPSPFELDFGTLDFGTSDSGLTNVLIEGVFLVNDSFFVKTSKHIHCIIAYSDIFFLQIPILKYFYFIFSVYIFGY